MPPLKLYPYQVAGAKWIAPRKTGALLDPMGLGKTAQAICAIPKNAAVVVLCPSSVKLNWRAEFKMWRPGFRVHVAQGIRAFHWPRPGNVVIANYEALPPAHREVQILRARYVRATAGQKTDTRKFQKMRARIHRAELQRKRLTMPQEGTVLIEDEAHRLKNPEAWVTMRARELAGAVAQKKGRIWILTGTPLINCKDELWTTLQAAGLGTEAFGNRDSFDEAWKTEGLVAEKLRAVSLARKREEALPFLPPKTREVRLVPIGKALRAELDALVAALKGKGLVLGKATLEQIREASAAVEFRDHVARLRVALAVAKVPAMLDYIVEREEAGVPLVVFCAHRKPLDMLGNRKGWLKITGDESAEQKREAVEKFQAGHLRGVAASYRAGGLGITLTRAWNMLHVDLPWTPADLSQAEDRLCRPGQKAKGLLYTRLVADHALERRVEVLLAEKQKLIEASVSASAVTWAGESPP